MFGILFNVVLLVSICFGRSLASEVGLERIVVTPSRIEESIQGTTGAITVYTRQDIENSNADTIKDFIKGALGLDIIQTGSFGGPVSVFLRGTNSNHNQIMIDGVRMYDPIAANGAFDLAHLTLDNIERIEVVRGPQSVLYGSDAIGGVVNIITRRGEGKPSLTVVAQGGSYDTARQSIASLGRIDSVSYSLAASHLKSHGISKFKGTSEIDPYENTAVSLRIDSDINSQNTLGLTGRFTDALHEYDNSVGLKDDPDMLGEEQQLCLNSYLESKLTDIWHQRIQFSFIRNYRQDTNDKDTAYPNDYLRDWYLGENQQLDWQHTLTPADFDTIVLGFNWQREKGNYYYYTEYLGGSSETHFPKVLSRTRGCYVHNMINLNDAFHLNAGIRIDDHSYFGTRHTYKADASYRFDTGTKIKASWGTAFKAPTLYQMHALPDPWFGGGNPTLQPEESQDHEVGFEQSAFGDKVHFGAVYFHTLLKNLIDAKYNPDTWLTERYSNVSKARIFGYETSIDFTPCREIRVNAGYTWQDTEDKTNGDELLRRPKNKCFTEVWFSPVGTLTFGLKLSYVGRRSDAANRLLKAYAKLDINGNYKLTNHLETFLRVENATDEVYEEVKNYAQPGRSYFGGVKVTF